MVAGAGVVLTANVIDGCAADTGSPARVFSGALLSARLLGDESSLLGAILGAAGLRGMFRLLRHLGYKRHALAHARDSPMPLSEQDAAGAARLCLVIEDARSSARMLVHLLPNVISRRSPPASLERAQPLCVDSDHRLSDGPSPTIPSASQSILRLLDKRMLLW